MTYFEPVGRGEGSCIGLGIGIFLRSRGRVASQCGTFDLVRTIAPLIHSPLLRDVYKPHRLIHTVKPQDDPTLVAFLVYAAQYQFDPDRPNGTGFSSIGTKEVAPSQPSKFDKFVSGSAYWAMNCLPL
jgi:hypothetical protein